MSEELIDVLSATGAATGERKAKRLVHRDGDWHRSAHLWIITPGRQVLLQRRAAGKENYGGFWDVAAAGHLSAGESAATAIVRETFEELGMEIGMDQLQFLGTVASECVLNGGTYTDREVHEVFGIMREVDAQALVLQCEEVAAVALLSFEDFASRVADADPTLVPHAVEYELVLKWMGMPCGSSRIFLAS